MELHREPLLYYLGLFLLLCVLLLGAEDAKGQDVPNVDSLLTVWEVEETAYAVYFSGQDTLRVWYNINGQPRIWRLEYNGERWARTLTGGTFLVTEEMVEALDLIRDPALRAAILALLEDEAVIDEAGNSF